MTVSTRCFRDPAGARTIKTGQKKGRWATSVILLAFGWTVGLSTDVSAQNISVTGGDVQSNVAPTTYDSITVSGTSALGAASTYTAAAQLTLNNSLSVSSSGVFNANANVTAGGQVSSYSGGVINLNNFDLTAGSLSLAEPTSLTRTGGHYSVSDLYLSGGASLNYGDNDSISGGILLDRASLSRTRSINAGYFGVSNTTFDLIAGDSFNNIYAENNITNGGVLNVNADVTVGGSVRTYSGGVVNLNGNLTVGNSVVSFSDGVLNLNNSNLTAYALHVGGPSSFTRTNGNYSVSNLYLSNGASLTYSDGDAITNYLSIDGISSSFAGYEPLSLNSLSITNGGVLSLHTFTGSGAISNWGLRLLDKATSCL